MAGRVLPVLVLRGLPALPDCPMDVVLSEESDVRAAESAVSYGGNIFLTWAASDEAVETPEKIGVIGRVMRVAASEKGKQRAMVRGMVRAEWLSDGRREPYRTMQVAVIRPEMPDKFECEAMGQVIRHLLRAQISLDPAAERLVRPLIDDDAEDLEHWFFRVAAAMPLKKEARQELLNRTDIRELYASLGTMLSDQNEVLRIRNDVQQQVRTRIDKHQRDFILREQLQVLQEQLGDTESDDADRYEKQTDELQASDEVKEALRREIKRLRAQSPRSQEGAVIAQYIETLLAMPWEKRCEEKDDIAGARAILERDHYGLEKVKERILEYLAVRSLRRQAGQTRDEAPILCLVGPPGTGKTSIAHSVAEALGKPFVRVCLGGVHDEAEIRGHRRTYVAAMPGRIAEGIRQAGVANPLMLLDELDKTSGDYRGDVGSALLEVLDPEQNRVFKDHYLDVPMDLSETLFLATANTTDTIPAPLLDRLEIIELDGYTENEKFHIAKNYLVKKQRTANGLSEKQFAVTDGALRALITGYTHEAGVRGLERQIGALARKAARKVLEGEASVRVRKTDLVPYLGRAKYKPDEIAARPQIGIVRGLAWTGAGGETLEVEVNTMPGKGELELTGQLGDVMKESALTALSYVRSVAEETGVDEDYFDKHDLHVHIPEGAVPKDGPSAGVTLATAFYSAVTDRLVREDVAMTGEVTLRGRVMPIGGLKEKLLAARTARVSTVLVPEENRPDVEELSGEVTEGLTIVYCRNMTDVLKRALV